MAKQAQAAPKKKPEAPPPPPPTETSTDAEWLCGNSSLVGPDGRKYRHGDPVAEFESWPDRARERLHKMGYVVRRTEFVKAYSTPSLQTPEPALVAKVRAATGKPKAKQAFPEVDHLAPFDPEVKVEDRDLPTLPLELEPGQSIELADGSTYQVPLEAVPEGQPVADSVAQQNGIDNMRVGCSLCNAEFPGIASLKQHEVEVHLAP